MKTRLHPANLQTVGAAACLLLITASCKKLPDPAFSYDPVDNPEAGEVIQFTNESEKATSYAWDFDDGGTSTLVNPGHVFQEAGIYGVKLSAFNDDGEESLVEPVTIFEPTVLGFTVYDSTGENAIAGADVWIYDNQYDLENLNEPLYTGITDINGDVLFMNLEPVVYYFLAFKEETGGIWLFAYSTPALEQNTENLFYFLCQWFPDAKKSTFDLKAFLKKDHPFSSRQLFPNTR